MKKFWKIFLPVLLVIAIFASIGWYLFVYDRDFTRDVLLQQARYHDTYGNSRLAAWFYDLAYEHSGKDENVAIELANQYKSDGNYTKAEYTLTNAIRDGATVELYTALCKTYVEQDKLLDAVNMLDNIADPELKAAMDALRPTAPAPDYAPDLYNDYISVALTSSAGTLYCTTDGVYPSTGSAAYAEPISLGIGQTVITCVSVADSGLVSPLSVLNYTIQGVVEEVTFSDPAMETAIRDLLGVSSNIVIYTNDLWDITEFVAPAEAEGYADLALLPNLLSLTIRDKSLGDLSFLLQLPKLQSLDLTGCSFSSEQLAHIASLPCLTHLSLEDCGLSTIASLSEAPGLLMLNLNKNTLRNLEAISGMTSLVEVHLAHNAVASLEYLKGLSNLETLDISYNSVTTLSPLSACIRLQWLDAGNNLLTDVAGIENALMLSFLNLEFNSIADVSSLAVCTELADLSISGNEITDITMLNTLTKLEVFDFSYNQVEALPQWPEGCPLRVLDGSYNQLTTLEPLKPMEQLTHLYMDYNELTKVDVLEYCWRLVIVNVYGNEIKDVSMLTKHDIIVNYDPTND